MSIQKKVGDRAQKTEKIQVGCIWRLLGIFDNHYGLHNKKLLLHAKDAVKYVTGTEGCSKGRDHINASEGKVVAVNIEDKNVTKLIEEDGCMQGASRQVLDVPKKRHKPVHTIVKSFLERIESRYGCPSTNVDTPCTLDSIIVLKSIQKQHGNVESSNILPDSATITESICQTMDMSTVSDSNLQTDLAAKMHLSKRLRTLEIGEHLSIKEAPRTLRSILSSPLSSPEHNSSSCFTSEDDKDGSVAAYVNFMEVNGAIHLSPVSVLEPSFNEDATNHIDAINQPDKQPVQPLDIDFEEESEFLDNGDSKSNIDSTCIGTVVQASRIIWNELSTKPDSSNQLLNNSSFDDHLLSDYINDLLQELKQRKTSYIRPDIQSFSVCKKKLVEEMMNEVQRYLVPSQVPSTLEHLMEKDIQNSVSWSGRWLETEEVVIQIVDCMLVESIMQTIFVIWS